MKIALPFNVNFFSNLIYLCTSKCVCVCVTDKRIPVNQICTLNVEMRDVFMCFASLHEAECTRALNKDSTKSYCKLFFVQVCVCVRL